MSASATPELSDCWLSLWWNIKLNKTHYNSIWKEARSMLLFVIPGVFLRALIIHMGRGTSQKRWISLPDTPELPDWEIPIWWNMKVNKTYYISLGARVSFYLPFVILGLFLRDLSIRSKRKTSLKRRISVFGDPELPNMELPCRSIKVNKTHYTSLEKRLCSFLLFVILWVFLRSIGIHLKSKTPPERRISQPTM